MKSFRRLQKLVIGAALAVVPLALHGAPACALPSLIASQRFTLGGGSGAVPNASTIEAFSVELGYQDLASGLGTVCDQPRVGCIPIPVAYLTAGSTFPYSSQNSPQMAYVGPRLADGIPQQLYTMIRTWGATGALPLAGGSGGPEPFLHGLVPSYIVLKVNSFSLGPGCCGYAEYTLDFTWQYYADLATPSAAGSWGRLKLLYR